jgi:hypothetical protein
MTQGLLSSEVLQGNHLQSEDEGVLIRHIPENP